MRTKTFAFFLIATLSFLATSVFSQTDITSADKQQIAEKLENFAQIVNSGDTEKITSIFSADNPSLLSQIQNNIRGGFSYQLDYAPFDKNIEILSQDQVKVEARFAASGIGCDVSGLSTYFIF